MLICFLYQIFQKYLILQENTFNYNKVYPKMSSQIKEKKDSFYSKTTEETATQITNREEKNNDGISSVGRIENSESMNQEKSNSANIKQSGQKSKSSLQTMGYGKTGVKKKQITQNFLVNDPILEEEPDEDSNMKNNPEEEEEKLGGVQCMETEKIPCFRQSLFRVEIQSSNSVSQDERSLKEKKAPLLFIPFFPETVSVDFQSDIEEKKTLIVNQASQKSCCKSYHD